MAEHKQADCRRQIVPLAFCVDFCNGLRQRSTSGLRDFPQPAPEFVFKTDACCVSTNHDRAFNDWRFHGVLLRGHLQFSQELTVIRSDLYGLLALAQGSDGGFQGAVAPQILFSMFSIRPIPI